jgi:flagellar protein FliO/FliZ
MTQSLVTVVLFVCFMLALPFVLRRIQQRRGMLPAGSGPNTAARIVSTLAVGPQQRVMTLEVGPAGARTWLVVGVTGQSITCLHSVPAGAEPVDG